MRRISGMIPKNRTSILVVSMMTNSRSHSPRKAAKRRRTYESNFPSIPASRQTGRLSLVAAFLRAIGATAPAANSVGDESVQHGDRRRLVGVRHL